MTNPPSIVDSPLLNNLIYGDLAPTVPVAWDDNNFKDVLAGIFLVGIVLLGVWYVMAKSVHSK
jgi:hypothetical protein